MAVDVLQLQGIALQLGDAAAQACAQRDALHEIAITWSTVAAEYLAEIEAKNRRIERLSGAVLELLTYACEGGLSATAHLEFLKILKGAE